MARGSLFLLLVLFSGVSVLGDEALEHHNNASSRASPESSATSMSPSAPSSVPITEAPGMAPSSNSSGTAEAAVSEVATASSVPSKTSPGAPQPSAQPTTKTLASTISSIAPPSSSLGVTQAPPSSPAVSSSGPSKASTEAPSAPPPPEPTSTWIPLKPTDLEVSGTPLADPAMTTTPFGKVKTISDSLSMPTTSSGLLTSPPNATVEPPLSHSDVPSNSTVLHPNSSMATVPSSLSPSSSSAVPTASPSDNSTSAASSRTTLSIVSVLSPVKPNPVDVAIICIFVCLLVGGGTLLVVWRYQRRIPRFSHLEEVTMSKVMEGSPSMHPAPR